MFTIHCLGVFDRKGNECLHIWFLQQFAKNILNKLLIVQKREKYILR